MAPVDYLCLIFGGITQISRELGISKQAVWQWKNGGKIPDRHTQKILNIARSRGLDITLADLVRGREIS